MIKVGDYVKCRESMIGTLTHTGGLPFDGYKVVQEVKIFDGVVYYYIPNGIWYSAEFLKKRKEPKVKNIMPLEEFTKHMEGIIRFLNKSHEANKALAVLTDDSSIVAFEFAYKLLDDYTKLLAKQVGDKSEWIEYFLYDCDCGKIPLEVQNGNTFYIMRDIKTLYEVITCK